MLINRDLNIDQNNHDHEFLIKQPQKVWEPWYKYFQKSSKNLKNWNFLPKLSKHSHPWMLLNIVMECLEIGLPHSEPAIFHFLQTSTTLLDSVCQPLLSCPPLSFLLLYISGTLPLPQNDNHFQIDLHMLATLSTTDTMPLSLSLSDRTWSLLTSPTREVYGKTKVPLQPR